VRPEERLRMAARAFARALRPGGLLLVEPWISSEDYQAGMPHMHTYESDELKVCRSNVSKRDSEHAILDFHWLVARADQDVEYFTERHVLRFYTQEQMQAALTDAGFEVRLDPDWRRGLYAAHKI
jgi:hypothetical protein